MLEQKQDGGTDSPGTCVAETSYRPVYVETVQGEFPPYGAIETLLMMITAFFLIIDDTFVIKI